MIEDLEPFARDVLAALSKSTSDSNFSTALDSDRASAVKGCLKLLEDLSLDGATFYGRYSITHADVVLRLRELTSEDEAAALSAWTAVLFVFAHSIEVSSTLGRDGSVPSVADLKLLRSVARRSPNFHSLIVELYDLPDKPEQDHANTIRWEKLELHRLGTSSVVFRVSDNADHAYAVKLSHVMFRQVGPVASATETYLARWGAISWRCTSIPEVRGSGTGWIIEDFVEGHTLREILDGSVDGLAIPTDSTAIKTIFAPIVSAVSNLHDASNGQGHGDLSPSNIIVDPSSVHESGGPWRVTLIDMGPNLLASHTVGRVTAAESRFVAPEVRRDYPGVTDVRGSADVFSLGHLLPYCLGFTGTSGFYGFDERVYAEEPELARLSARLVSADVVPRNEFLERGDLQRLAEDALKVTKLSEVFDTFSLNRKDQLVLQSLLGSWGAVKGAAMQLFTVFSSGRDGGNSYREVVPALRICLAGLAFALGFFIMVYSALLQIPLDILGLGDNFQRLGFDPAANPENWEVRAVGASFLIACFQYNLRAFGGVTLLGTRLPVRLRSASESLLWVLTIVVLIDIVVCTFVRPRLWIVCSAAGLMLVAVNNLVHREARDKVKATLVPPAVEPSSVRRRVPADDWRAGSRILQSGYKDILDYWTPTCVTYAAVLGVLAVLSMAGAIKDWSVWAGAIAAVNLFVFSYSQATKQGPELRVELQQYVVLASAGEI